MKLLSLIITIGLGLAVSVAAQTTTDQQQQQQQQPPPIKGKNTKVEQTTEQPAGPVMGHSDREQVKDTSKPTQMKSGGTAGGAAVQTTTVFRNGKQTNERLSLHQS